MTKSDIIDLCACCMASLSAGYLFAMYRHKEFSKGIIEWGFITLSFVLLIADIIMHLR